MRNIAIRAVRSLGLDVKRYSLFKRAVETLVRKGEPSFVQIGANNGVDFDDLFSIVTRYNLRGVVVEPIGYYFRTLEEVYKTRSNIVAVNAAIHPTAKEIRLYRVDPAKVSILWQHGIASFSRDHLTKNHDIPADAVIEEVVPALSLAELVARYLPRGIDILACDTEGFDGEIMKMVDLHSIRPKVIRFESKHLDRDVLAALDQRLSDAGYAVEKGWEDWVAVDRSIASRLSYLLA